MVRNIIYGVMGTVVFLVAGLALGLIIGAFIGGNYLTEFESGNIINLNGGNVTATGGSYAAGIGGGFSGSGNNITIRGGKINSAGGLGATSIGGRTDTAVPIMISPAAGKKITVMVGPVEPPTTVAGIFTSPTSYTAVDRYLYAFEGPILGIYPATVINGTGSGNYAEGTTVNITADTTPAGKEFDQWTTADGVSFANAAESSTSFTMPAKAVTITATYKDLPVSTIWVDPVKAPKIVDIILTEAGVPSNYTVGKGKNSKKINFTKEVAMNMTSKTEIMWNGELVPPGIWVDVDGIQLEVMNPDYWEAISCYMNELIIQSISWCGLEPFTYCYDDYCNDLQSP